MTSWYNDSVMTLFQGGNTDLLQAAQPGVWDMAAWSPTEWAGVLGFVMSALLTLAAGVYWVVKWYRTRPLFKLEGRVLPGKFQLGDNIIFVENYSIAVHHVRGKPFRLHGVYLILRTDEWTLAEEQRYVELKQCKLRSCYKITGRCALRNASVSPGAHAEIVSGDTLLCDFEIKPEHALWELIDTRRPFAFMAVVSQGQPLYCWDISNDVRPLADTYKERIRGSSNAIRDIPEIHAEVRDYEESKIAVRTRARPCRKSKWTRLNRIHLA